MNQILSMDPGMGEPRRNNPLETNTTVLIFAIALIIFGLILIGTGTFNLVKSLTGDKTPAEVWPKFEPYQEENTLYLTVSHDQIIDRVVYYWNNGFEKTVQGENTKHLVVTIDVPVGDNILNVKSIDINGKETAYQKSFTGEQLEDTVKPVIELSILGSKLNISAKTTTETGLAYLTYKWNNGEETRVDATDDKILIETKTTIAKGENTIVITAVKENGVSATETKKFIGAVKPTITVNQEGDKLLVVLEHESGLKSANIVFNDRKVGLTSDRFGEDKKTVEFTLSLKSGQQNTLKIDVTSWDGATESFNGVAQTN